MDLKEHHKDRINKNKGIAHRFLDKIDTVDAMIVGILMGIFGNFFSTFAYELFFKSSDVRIKLIFMSLFGWSFLILIVYLFLIRKSLHKDLKFVKTDIKQSKGALSVLKK